MLINRLAAIKEWIGKIRRKPTQVLVIGFAGIICIGSILLSLPIAAANGHGIGYFNALFTSTSAVCVTGLIVVDTGTTFSLFGKMVLLLLIQTGGLGFMTMATLVMMILGRRITLQDRLVMQESMGDFGLSGLVRLTRWILSMTLLVEMAGAVLLSTRFVPRFGLARGVFYSIFHAISAFCNAGFDLMGNYASLTSFQNDGIVQLVIMALITIGGLGFSVIYDITQHFQQKRRITLHTKLVLVINAMLLCFGAFFFLIMEWNNAGTLASPTMYPWMRPLNAFFQSVTLRTAGYNTIDQAAMTDASKVLSILLMFVGASPASTGGGIKTTTMAVLLLMILSTVRGQEETTAFHRRLPRAIVQRAIAITIISIGLLIGGIMLITLFEHGVHADMDNRSFLHLAFEMVSAFGTVGVSCDVTPRLSAPSRLLVIVFMFIGRVGPLTMTLALARKQKRGRTHIHYPEERIMVG